MSIVTKTGDDGTTGLMYNRRVSKSHPRVASYGAVDELNAALGLARAQAPAPELADLIHGFQRALVVLMGELATEQRDLERYRADQFRLVDAAMTRGLDELTEELEAEMPPLRDWVMPGGSVCGAALDLARTVCRRAEREVVQLQESEPGGNPEIVVYLNRLADLLWLLARQIERPNTSNRTAAGAASAGRPPK